MLAAVGGQGCKLLDVFFFSYFTLYSLSIPVKLAVYAVEDKEYLCAYVMLTVQTTWSEQLHENFAHAISCQLIVKNEASFSECSIHINCF